MKKIPRILSVALVAMMLSSLCAIAQADDTTAYIPAKLGKLGLDMVMDDFQYPELSIKITDLAWKYETVEGRKIKMRTDPDYCVDPETGLGYYFKSITEDSVAQLQFSEKPDWAGVVVSSLDGGWIALDIDEDGYAEYDIGELHRQPGMWSWYSSGDGWSAHGSGGDYPYSAGKNYGDYSVNVSYHRSGAAYKLVVTMNKAEDPFRTGLEVDHVSVTFENVDVITYCYADAVTEWENNQHKDPVSGLYYPKPQPMSMWYLSHVEAIYTEGSYVAGVGTDWRNDKKQNLASYRVVYAVSEKDYYMITYAPKTTTINENKSGSTVFTDGAGNVCDLTQGNTTGAFYKATGIQPPEDYVELSRQNICGGYLPSASIPAVDATGAVIGTDYLHHYTADQPIFGLYYKSRDDWMNSNPYAISGSGNNLNKWYGYAVLAGVQTNNGKRIRSVKKGVTSFKSIRRLTK